MSRWFVCGFVISMRFWICHFFHIFFLFLSRLAGNFMHSSATRGKDRLPFFSALVKLSTFSCIFVLFSPYFWLLCSTFVAKWPYYFGYHVVKSPCFELLLDVLSSLSQRLCWDIVVEPKQYQATSMLHGKNRNTFSFSHPLECGKLSKKMNETMKSAHKQSISHTFSEKEIFYLFCLKNGNRPGMKSEDEESNE